MAYRYFNRIRSLNQPQRVAEHHGNAHDLSDGVGNVLPCPSRGAAVNRLIHAKGPLASPGHPGEARRGEHPHRAGEHGGFVGEDVAKHVTGDDDIEIGGALNESHGAGIDQHMLKLHVGVIRG